jgi:ABC-type transport system involved in multi-copper enzyme maturation permease subunit/pimeloyl-ACP methyl ester carboxylesterase
MKQIVSILMCLCAISVRAQVREKVDIYFRGNHVFPLEEGIFITDIQFGPVLANTAGTTSATLSIVNTNGKSVVIDEIDWEENDWLEKSSISIGELASGSSRTFSFHVRIKPIQQFAISRSIRIHISAYRDSTRINRIPVEAYITGFLTPLDGNERGRVTRGFKSSLDSIVRPCLIYLPESHRPEQNLPLLVALNPVTTMDEEEELNTYFYYELERYASAEGFAVVCLNTRPGSRWGGQATYDVLDALEIVQAHFPIDPDRIYLFGAGSGGDAAYRLGLQYPDLFAAMAVAEAVGPTDLTKNALNLPLYIVNGIWRGANYNELQAFRKMVKLFSSHGCIVEHKEHPDATWRDFLSQEWESIFDWFSQHRRVAYPRKVSYSTGRLISEDVPADRIYGIYWVRIVSGKDVYAVPQIDVAVIDNSINVTAVNIEQYTLLLSHELLDLNAPITVRTNGKVSFSGQVEKQADNTATLIIDLEPKRITWIFAVIVGVVALVGLGVVCLRLVKIRAKARQAVTGVPTLTAGFRGIWLIAMKEFRLHMLTEKFLWTTILCLGMVLMSFWLMTQDYHTRLANHSFSLQKPQNLYSGGLFWYNLQPNHGTGRMTYVRPTPIIKEPSVMSIFVLGLEKRMSRPAYYSFHQELVLNDTPHTNFLMDMYAKPDLMYIVQIAMSLLALLFVFQSVCGERETGTLKLMIANAVPRDTILLGKWLGGYLGLMLPFLLATGIGVLALNLMPSISLNAEHWIRLAWLILASMLYISVFFTLGILISALTKRTMTAFLAALFAWVILVLVLPNTGTLLARELKPVESIQQLQVKEYVMKRRMEDERQKVRHSADWICSYGQIHYEIWHDIREAVWNLDAEHRRRTQHLADYTRILTRVSPAAAYAYAMMDIAGTSINDELVYHDQLRRFIRNRPEEAQQYVWNLRYTHQTWNFRYMQVSWQEGITRAMVDLLLLALTNVILFLFAFLAFIRYQIT